MAINKKIGLVCCVAILGAFGVSNATQMDAEAVQKTDVVIKSLWSDICSYDQTIQIGISYLTEAEIDLKTDKYNLEGNLVRSGKVGHTLITQIHNHLDSLNLFEDEKTLGPKMYEMGTLFVEMRNNLGNQFVNHFGEPLFGQPAKEMQSKIFSALSYLLDGLKTKGESFTSDQ